MRSLALFVLVVACACGRYNEPRMFQDSVRQVPDVVQETAANASAELEAEGFLVRLQRSGGTTDESLDVDRCPNTKVARTDPAAGEKVMKATTVTIVVARC